MLMESDRSGEVPESEWPYAIADVLHPEAIRIEEEGVYILTSAFLASETGVFVPRHPKLFTPVPGADPEYNRVALDVYTYKVRG